MNKILLFLASIISIIIQHFTGIYYTKEQILTSCNPLRIIEKF